MGADADDAAAAEAEAEVLVTDDPAFPLQPGPPKKKMAQIHSKPNAFAHPRVSLDIGEPYNVGDVAKRMLPRLPM